MQKKNPKRGVNQRFQRSVEPSPKSFSVNPKAALKREISTDAQKNFYEGTIIYGEDDAFPLRLAQAVQKSPATSACISTKSQFIKGAGFSDKRLMKQKINANGETLWQLHCKLADMLALFEGFAVNLKFNSLQEITSCYDMAFESIRFVKPKEDLVTYIDQIVYNPYFGTIEYKKEFSKQYPLFDRDRLPEQLESMQAKFPGQVYYYGKTTPLHRFYSMPRYFKSAEKWINIDGKIQEFHDENLDNGFFQSVLLTVIGDPNQWSNNPRTQEKYTKDDGTEGFRPTKTVGEEFNDQMQEAFSGSKKAGNVMVQWAVNQNEIQKVQPFPSNTNADLFLALQDLTTKNITIATKTPSILANISEGVSLGSAGSEIQKAIELMQSNVVEDQMTLEDFYNDVLLPGMGIEGNVKIVNFNPISSKPEIEDKIWEFLNDEEKKQWIVKNFPDITITRSFVSQAPPTAEGQPPAQVNTLPAQQQTAPPAGNSALSNLSIAKLNKIQKLVARYNLGLTDPSNTRALTYEQAKQLIMAEGFTEQEMDAWLVKPEELDD